MIFKRKKKTVTKFDAVVERPSLSASSEKSTMDMTCIFPFEPFENEDSFINNDDRSKSGTYVEECSVDRTKSETLIEEWKKEEAMWVISETDTEFSFAVPNSSPNVSSLTMESRPITPSNDIVDFGDSFFSGEDNMNNNSDIIFDSFSSEVKKEDPLRFIKSSSSEDLVPFETAFEDVNGFEETESTYDRKSKNSNPSERSLFDTASQELDMNKSHDEFAISSSLYATAKTTTQSFQITDVQKESNDYDTTENFFENSQAFQNNNVSSKANLSEFLTSYFDEETVNSVVSNLISNNEENWEENVGHPFGESNDNRGGLQVFFEKKSDACDASISSTCSDETQVTSNTDKRNDSVCDYRATDNSGMGQFPNKPDKRQIPSPSNPYRKKLHACSADSPVFSGLFSGAVKDAEESCVITTDVVENSGSKYIIRVVNNSMDFPAQKDCLQQNNDGNSNSYRCTDEIFKMLDIEVISDMLLDKVEQSVA